MVPDSSDPEVSETLLRNSDEGKDLVDPRSAHRFYDIIGHRVYLTIIFCLVTSNVSLQTWNSPFCADSISAQGETIGSRSQFASLWYNTPTIYTNYSDYMSTNQTLTNDSWENLDTNPLVVALTNEYAALHNIEPSQLRFVWDESKGIYFVKLFHSLHCLKGMRKAFSDSEHGQLTEHAKWHFHHCLDSLRQDLLCQADDTPMPLVKFPDHVGYGQVRICRNYNDLVAWINDPERNACYRRFTDYRGVENKIEMYAFCPEDSPYYELQNAYFDKWGHLDPFGEDGDHID